MEEIYKELNNDILILRDKILSPVPLSKKEEKRLKEKGFSILDIPGTENKIIIDWDKNLKAEFICTDPILYLMTRDLTIEAVARKKDGTEIDLFDGKKHQKEKLIKCINPEVQFKIKSGNLILKILFYKSKGWKIEEWTELFLVEKIDKPPVFIDPNVFYKMLKGNDNLEFMKTLYQYRFMPPFTGFYRVIKPPVYDLLIEMLAVSNDDFIIDNLPLTDEERLAIEIVSQVFMEKKIDKEKLRILKHSDKKLYATVALIIQKIKKGTQHDSNRY